MIKAVFLDLWDTLIYSEPGPIETYTRMELESITKTLSRVKNIDIDRVARAYRVLVEYRGVIKPGVYAKLLASLLGFNPNDPLLEEVAVEYEFGAVQYTPRVVEGARELLEYIKNKGLKTALVTNTHFSSSTLRIILGNAGLSRYIDVIVSSADYEVLKPHPRIFEIAMNALGVKPFEAIHIGDSCSRDVLGAYVSGIKPILYARRSESIRACEEIPGLTIIYSLREAIPVLEKILGE